MFKKYLYSFVHSYLNYANLACRKQSMKCCKMVYNHGKKLMDKRENLRESSISYGYGKVLNYSLKAEKQLQNENHTEDWGTR